MRRLLIIFAFALLFGTGAPVVTGSQTPAYAQGAGEIAGTLSRLKNNPRYRGRILGTHIIRDGRRYVYEVRILRPDDRVILVYIDPETGGVVGDSERRPVVSPNRGNRGAQDPGRGRGWERGSRGNGPGRGNSGNPPGHGNRR